VLLYALLSFFIADELGLRFGSDEDGFGNLAFHEQYLLLLGGPFAAAVAAKGLTSQRAEDGTTLKSTAETPDQQDISQGAREIISDDSGRTSLPDFQYFMFNLVALTIFLVSFIPHLQEGLPELPNFLVALTSLSALTYLGTKAVTRQTPTIAAIVPGKARRSETVEVSGTHFTNGPNAPAPTVTIDGIPATATLKKRQRIPGDEVVLVVTVPDAASVGTGKALAVRPPGATASATANLQDIDTEITSVEPETIVWAPQEALTIKGSGFGEARATGETVQLGDVDLSVVEWTDTRIRAQLPDTVADTTLPTSPVVAIVRPGHATRSLSVKLADRVMSVSEVKPSPIKLAPGGLVEIVGTGFGTTPGAEDDAKVLLGGIELLNGEWADTRVTATLPEPMAAPLENKAGGPADLTISRKGRRKDSRSVDLALPAVTVTSVTPEAVPMREGEKLHVVGTGFGPTAQAPPAVTLGSMTLTVDSGHTDTLLVATLPARATSAGATLDAAGTSETLIVRRTGWQEALQPVKLTTPQ